MFAGQWWKDQFWWVLPSGQEYGHSHKDGCRGVDVQTESCVFCPVIPVRIGCEFSFLTIHIGTFRQLFIEFQRFESLDKNM